MSNYTNWLIGRNPIGFVLFSLWSINFVKQEVSSILGNRESKLQLICGNIALEGHKLVSDYSSLIFNGSTLVVQRKYVLFLRPTVKKMEITDHDPLASIQLFIERNLNIPVQHQVVFMENEFQTDAQKTFPDLTSTVAYIVDARDNIALTCIELPNKTRQPLLLAQPWTISNLNKVIEQQLGYAIQAQQIQLQNSLPMYNISKKTMSISQKFQRSSFTAQDRQTWTDHAKICHGTIINLSINTSGLFLRNRDSPNKTYNISVIPTMSVKTVIDSLSKYHDILPYRIQLFKYPSNVYLAETDRSLSSYDLEGGHIIEIVIRSPTKRIVSIMLPSGKLLEPEMFMEDRIIALKRTIQRTEGIAIHCQVILKNDHELPDNMLIFDCVQDWNQPLNVKIVLSGPLSLDPSLLAPRFDYDFTNIDDQGRVFKRGNYVYERPCGCRRIALNVAGKYGTDDRWLGKTGTDLEEWPVSYHGTAQLNAETIADEGFRLSKCNRFLFGKGIYSTPEIRVAQRFAKSFEHEGQKYFVIMQNRVNPKYFEIINKERTLVGEYWVSSKGNNVDSDDDIKDLIRPYAICIFKA